MRVILLLACLLCIPILTHAGTFYIDNTSGNDSNNGTSKATPWKHLKCMVGSAGNAAAHTPVAGDQFILKGGETWGNANFPCIWKWNGTAANNILVGTDPTWFTGGSWTRPKFSGNGIQMVGPRNIFISFFDYTGPNTGASYVWISNIEFTGMHWTTNYGYGFCEAIFAFAASHITLDRIYIHGWTHGAYPGTSDACVTGILGDTNAPFNVGSLLQNSVFDGSDSTNGGDMGTVMYAWGGDIKGNVMHAHSNMILAIHSGEISNNHVYDCKDNPNPSSHENMFEIIQGSGTNGVFYIHDNVFHDSVPGCEAAFLGNPGETDYVWNNLWYNLNGNPPELTQASSPGVASYWWNNTIVPPAGQYCLRSGHTGTYTTIKFQNNHCITTAIRPDDPALSATTKTITNNIRQDPSTATTQGYTNAQTPYVYFPGAGDATVGAGLNLSANCTGLLVGLCNDTSYGSVVSGTSVTGVGRTVRSRTIPWDVGAYQFGGDITPPSAPTNLVIN